MIPIHHPGTNKLVGRYDLETGEVRDVWGHLLFYHRVVDGVESIVSTLNKRETAIPVKALRELRVGAGD